MIDFYNDLVASAKLFETRVNLNEVSGVLFTGVGFWNSIGCLTVSEDTGS